MTANLLLLLASLFPMYLVCTRHDGRGHASMLFFAFIILAPLGAAPVASIANIHFEGFSPAFYYLFVSLAGGCIVYFAVSVRKQPSSALQLLLYLILGLLFVFVIIDAIFSAPESGPTPHIFDRLELVGSWVTLLLATGGMASALCWHAVTKFAPSKVIMAACSIAVWIGSALTGLGM